MRIDPVRIAQRGNAMSVRPQLCRLVVAVGPIFVQVYYAYKTNLFTSYAEDILYRAQFTNKPPPRPPPPPPRGPPD